jgi:DNA repair protein RadC
MTKKRTPVGQYELSFDDTHDRPHIEERSDPQSLRVEEQGIVNHAFRILQARHRHGDVLASPEVTHAYLRLKLAEELNEVFGCIFLDNRHRVIKDEYLFRGTIDGASVHPRVVVQKTVLYNAAAVLFYHNHPSGVAEPSQADLRITSRLKDALALVEVRVLDHIVVSVDGHTSLAERGLI